MRHKKILILILLLLMVLTGCAEVASGKPTFNSLYDFTYTIGEEHPDYLANITASDSEDGDISSAIYFNDSDVDYDEPGDYTLTYYVVDSEGHLVSASVTVTVVEPEQALDTTAPQILGASNISYTIGDPTPDYLYGVSALDDVDINLTQTITVDDSAVDYETPGTYPVVYTVSDLSDNEASVTVYITVSDVQQFITFDVYYLNDFHGAILPDEDKMGFAAISNLIMTKKEASPQSTIFLAGGDMLQGNLLSNYYYGASTIEMLNLMGLDAFVLGNHEFDWGLDIILPYFDQNSDAAVHANFPLLGANIIETATGERPEGVDAYTIIQKQGIKIGVIGTMGYGLESAIAASRIAGYEFQEPVAWTEYYATYLRTVEDVDIVVAVNHGDSDYFNNSVADFTGDARVDFIYNGHSHQAYIDQYNRDGMDAYIMQSSSNGRAVGYARWDLIDGALSGWQSYNLTTSNEALLTSSNTEMQALIDEYSAAVADLIDTNIITAGEYLSRTGLTEYISEIIRIKTDSDVGIHNFGGTRTDVSLNQEMTVALAYEIFPFDNVVVTVELLGSTIKTLMTYTDLGFNTDIQNFEDNTYYKVAVNDYVYGNYPNTFGSGQNAVDTGLMLRDMFIEVLEDLSAAGNDYFYFSLDIPEPLSIDTYTLLLNKESDYIRDIIN